MEAIYAVLNNLGRAVFFTLSRSVMRKPKIGVDLRRFWEKGHTKASRQNTYE